MFRTCALFCSTVLWVSVFGFMQTFFPFVLSQIMHAFSVAPFDQNLSIDGKILTDDCATLGTLGVIPESVILLKVSNSTLAMFRVTLCSVSVPEKVVVTSILSRMWFQRLQ